MSKKFTITKSLPCIKIPATLIDKLFDQNKKIQLTYQHTICEVLSSAYGCPFNVIKKNESKFTASMYLNCIVDESKVFKVTFDLRVIKFDKDLTARVEINSENLCNGHEDTPDGRYLSHEKRTQMIDKLATSTAVEVFNHQLILNFLIS